MPVSPPFSFYGQSQQDPTLQAGLNQYIQQGQSQIDPGQAQVAASNPIAGAGMANLAAALQKSPQQSPMQPIDHSAGQMAMGQANPMTTAQSMDPNASFMNGSQPLQGQAGPTQENLALAQGLMKYPNALRNYSFLNGGQ